MTSPKTLHKNPNLILSKLMFWLALTSITTIAIVVFTKLFIMQNTPNIHILKDIIYSSIIYIIIPAFNILAIFGIGQHVKQNKNLDFYPAYGVLATIFCNSIFIATFSILDILLNSKIQIFEILQTNYISSMAITSFISFGLLIYFEDNTARDFLLNITNFGILSIISVNIISQNLKATHIQFPSLSNFIEFAIITLYFIIGCLGLLLFSLAFSSKDDIV